ncbi:MAG: hypothetical protein GEU78_01830 [Actinobacteria bacterium]|nr:hypothetical protein [Actinomycetota bacterium]
MTDVPFFIVGSARSGTTLLRLMLNAHSRVAVPPESRFICEFWTGEADIDVTDYLTQLATHKRYQLWDLPVHIVRAEIGDRDRMRFAEAIDATFHAWARVHGKSRWGDKTPRYIECMPLILSLFPGARFVHLVRDGRNVALSYADVPFGPKTVAKAADLWARRVRIGMQEGRSMEPGHYIEIVYEDLVEDPLGEVKTLCEFIDLEFEPDMLDYTEKARSAMLPSAKTLNPHVSEKPHAVRAWQTEMPDEHVEIFEAVAGDTLSELGYERRFPSPSGKAKMLAALGKAGAPVAKLRSSPSR